MKVRHQPFDPGPAAWNELLPPAPEYPALEERLAADVAIIGAGFTGLSAARRLHQLDPNLKIAALEARRVAEGPAGRNSGFMIDLPHNLASTDYAGDQHRDLEQTVLNRTAIAFAEEAVADYGIDAEAFSKTGKINAAATKKGSKHNRNYAGHLEALGEPYELLDAAQMKSVSGSDYYDSGLFTPGTAMIQPALYVRGLAEGLKRDGIGLFERSPVIKFQRESGVWVLETSAGTVSAKKVILATNGHAESFGFFQRRLMHIYLYASMTRALTVDEIKSLGGEERWGFTPADPMGSTVRRISGTGGTRLISRNSISWAPKLSVSKDKHLDFARVHDRSFSARFPKLKDVKMEYRWGGKICLSLNAAPAFGEVETNLYSACCQNGLGTTMGTLAGIAAADKAIGSPTRIASAFDSQPKPKKLPAEPFASIGANALMLWKEFKAGKEV